MTYAASVDRDRLMEDMSSRPTRAGVHAEPSPYLLPRSVEIRSSKEAGGAVVLALSYIDHELPGRDRFTSAGAIITFGATSGRVLEVWATNIGERAHTPSGRLLIEVLENVMLPAVARLIEQSKKPLNAQAVRVIL